LAISDLKQLIEGKKFIAGDSEENVAAWGESIEENVALADEKVKQLNEFIFHPARFLLFLSGNIFNIPL
jgi:hypothetical protein